MNLPVRLTRRLVVAGGLALAIAPPALAHRSQSVLSTIRWNAAKSAVEVSHRLHVHDAAVAVGQQMGMEEADVTQAKYQALLMRYVEKTFSLADSKTPIALTPLAPEFQQEAVLLHQEARLAAPPANLVIADQILCDVFDGQTNLVNIHSGQKTRTLIFAPKDGPKQVSGMF